MKPSPGQSLPLKGNLPPRPVPMKTSKSNVIPTISTPTIKPGTSTFISGKTIPEDARHAIDILRKWEHVIVEQWKDIRLRLSRVNVQVNGILEIKKSDSLIGTIEPDRDSIYMIVGNDRTLLLEAVQFNDNFDIDTLSGFRWLIKETFDGYRNKAKELELAAEKAAQEKQRKLKEVLPKILDEFGADIMQYGEPGK